MTDDNDSIRGFSYCISNPFCLYDEVLIASDDNGLKSPSHYFIDSTFAHNDDSHLTLSILISSGAHVWQGMQLNVNDIKPNSRKLESLDIYTRTLRMSLEKPSPQFVYEFSDDSFGDLSFVIKERLMSSPGQTAVLFKQKISRLADTAVGNFDLLNRACEVISKQAEDITVCAQEIEARGNTISQLQDELSKVTEYKDALQTSLLQKFVLLLNSKKREIRRLQLLLDACGESITTATVPEDSPKLEAKKPATKTRVPVKTNTDKPKRTYTRKAAPVLQTKPLDADELQVESNSEPERNVDVAVTSAASSSVASSSSVLSVAVSNVSSQLLSGSDITTYLSQSTSSAPSAQSGSIRITRSNSSQSQDEVKLTTKKPNKRSRLIDSDGDNSSEDEKILVSPRGKTNPAARSNSGARSGSGSSRSASIGHVASEPKKLDHSRFGKEVTAPSDAVSKTEGKLGAPKKKKTLAEKVMDSSDDDVPGNGIITTVTRWKKFTVTAKAIQRAMREDLASMSAPSSLQIAYENAKARGSELAAMSKSAPNHLKPQLLAAAKTYQAISTVIFASICMSQIDSLEGFIKNTSQTLPPSLFDGSEWEGPIKHAEITRSIRGQINDDNNDMVAFRTGKVAEMQKSLAQLSKDVSAEITQMSSTLNSFKGQLVPLLKKETQRYAELQQKFNDIDENNQKAINEMLAKQEEKLAIAKQNEAKATEELATANSSFAEKIEDLKYGYEAEIDRLKDAIAQSEVPALKLEITELKQTIKNQFDDIQAAKQELASTTQKSEETIKQNEARIQELLSEIDALKSDSTYVRNEMEGLEKELSSAKNVNDNYKKENTELQEKLRSNSQDIDRLNNSLNEKNALIASLQSKLGEELQHSAAIESELQVQINTLSKEHEQIAQLEKQREQQEIQKVTHNLAAQFVLHSEENVMEHIKDIEYRKETNQLKDEITKDMDTIKKLQDQIGGLQQQLGQLHSELEVKLSENENLSSKVVETEEQLRASRCISPEREVELSVSISELQEQLRQSKAEADEAIAIQRQEYENQLNEIRTFQSLAEVKYTELLEGFNEYRMKASAEYSALQNQHVEALENLKKVLESTPEAARSAAASGSHHHAHVKFADLTPHLGENFDDPLLQRLVADVKNLAEHVADVEDEEKQLKQELQTTKELLQTEMITEEHLKEEIAEKDHVLRDQVAQFKKNEIELHEKIKVLTRELEIVNAKLADEKTSESTLEAKLQRMQSELGREVAIEESIKESSIERERQLEETLSELQTKLKASTLLCEKNDAKVVELTTKFEDNENELNEIKSKFDSMKSQLESATEELAKEKTAKQQLEEENKSLSETLQNSTTEAISSNESSTPPTHVLQQYISEIASLEEELTNVRQVADGKELILQNKTDELLRVVHTLKCTVDEKDNAIEVLTKELDVKSRNASDAETQELILLEQIAELTASKKVAIDACDVLKTQITELATQLSGVQAGKDENDIEVALALIRARTAEQETATVILEDHIATVTRVQEALTETVDTLHKEVSAKDELISSLKQQLLVYSDALKKQKPQSQKQSTRSIKATSAVVADPETKLQQKPQSQKQSDVSLNNSAKTAEPAAIEAAAANPAPSEQIQQDNENALPAAESNATDVSVSAVEDSQTSESNIINTKLDQDIEEELPELLPEAYDCPPSRDPELELLSVADANETASAETDTRLYLVTIKDLQDQINESKAALLSELNNKQKELEAAKDSVNSLTKQIADLRSVKGQTIATNMKSLKESIIERLAIDMAARVEATVIAKKATESSLSRPGTADLGAGVGSIASKAANPRGNANATEDARPKSAAQIMVINTYAEVAGRTDPSAITVPEGAMTSGNVPVAAGNPNDISFASTGTSVPAGQQTWPAQQPLMDMTYDDEEEVFNPSRVLPKIGARRSRALQSSGGSNGDTMTSDPSQTLPQNLEHISIEASGRVASPNLEDAIRNFYTPQKKIGDQKRGPGSIDGARARAEASKVVGNNLPDIKLMNRGLANPSETAATYSADEINQYCQVEIAKENERGQDFINSLAGKDNEIIELRKEVYQVQQALSAARGEIVVKIVQLNELEQKCASLQLDVNEQKQLLSFANEKLRTLEMRREQTEIQKQMAEDKANDTLRLARKCSELEGQLFDAHRAVKITTTELERAKTALTEAVQNANAKYRVKFLGSSEKVRRGVRHLQAIVRGCQSRMKSQHLYVQKVAQEMGTLIAAEGTVQGESGWYAGPDGSLYYFIHDKGVWTPTVGPLTLHQCKALFETSRARSKSSIENMLSPFEGRVQVKLPPGSSVFLENKTKKLYVASQLVL